MKKTSNIEFGALRIFSAVADSDTMTQAAERLGITQSAVSQTIKQLEAQTATELVRRRSRPIQLTPGGHILKSYAAQILADTQRMLTDIRAVSANGIPQLNLGMIDSFGDLASQQIMKKIKPFVSNLSFRTGIAAPLSDALINRDLDMLITTDPLDDHPEILNHPILRDPFVMIVPETYCLKDEPSPQWLAKNVPFVRYGRETRIGALTDLIARRLNIELQTHYELDSTQTLLRFVQSGHGWSIVSGLCLIRYPELLEGTTILQLANGANARYLALRCRDKELGELPTKTAEICREIYTNDLVPQLIKKAPWLEQYAYAITEMPLI